MQRLEDGGAVRPLYGSLGFKELIYHFQAIFLLSIMDTVHKTKDYALLSEC